MADDKLPRRKFLLGAGLAGTAVAAGLAPATPAEAQTPQAVAAAATKPAAEPPTYLVLTASEVAFISAAAERAGDILTFALL